MRHLGTLLWLWLVTGSPAAWAVSPWQAHSLSEAVAQGAWERSETLCREILEEKTLPANQQAAVQYNLAVSYQQQKKFDQARPLFESLAEQSDDSDLQAKASYNLGCVLFAQDQLEPARKAFEKSLLLQPEDDDARYNIEVILRKQKQQDPQQSKKPPQDQDNQQDENQDKNQDKNQGKKPETKPNQDGEPPPGGGQNPDSQPSPGATPPAGQKPAEGKNDPSRSGPTPSPAKPESGDRGAPGRKPGQASPAEAAQANAEQKKAAQEAQERARLLEYFRQQERDGRPPLRGPAVPPPPGGKTW